MQWYYATNNERQGPVTEAEFEQLLASGTIKADTLVWRQGMANWERYSAVSNAASGAMPASTGTEDTEVCVVSGKRYPKREMIQYEGRWVSAEHRDTFFQHLREGVMPAGFGPVPGPYGYGGFWLRAAAKIIDGIILLVVGTILNVLLSLAMFGSANYFSVLVTAEPWARLKYQLFSNLGGVVIALTYAIVFIRRYSATPGKMAVGLKLLRPDGSELGVGRIIGRYFAEMLSMLILAVGYIMAGVDEEKRALHDRICDTRVIKSRQ